MADYGLYSGLAVKGNTGDLINDIQYHDHVMAQNKALAQSKAALFANDIQYQNASNSFDNARIKSFADGKIKEIGKFYKENPDVMYNPDKLVILNQMKKELRDNPDTIRGFASDASFKQLNDDLAEVAKNPEMYDQEAYQMLLNQKENYLKYGNQFGIEAAQKDGLRPFVYSKPRNFVNLPKSLMEIGAGITNYDVEKGQNPGEWWTKPNPEAIKAAKASAYQEHRRQIEVEARKAGIDNPVAIDKWVEQQIANGFKKHYSIGDPNALFNRQIALANLAETRRHHAATEKPKDGNGTGFSSFDEIFRKDKPAGYLNQGAAQKTWGDNPPVILQGTSGKKVDLTGHNFNYDGRYVTANGIKFATGFVKLPLDIAEQYGIYQQGFFTKDGITSDFTGQASLEKGVDKDGKPVDYIKVNYGLPLDGNDKKARVIFDTYSQPDKTVDIPAASNDKPLTVIQNGFTYTWNPATGQYE